MHSIPLLTEYLDDMFAEFDASLAISRSVFSQVPVPQHARWQQVRGENAHACLYATFYVQLTFVACA